MVLCARSFRFIIALIAAPLSLIIEKIPAHVSPQLCLFHLTRLMLRLSCSNGYFRVRMLEVRLDSHVYQCVRA